MAIQKLVQSQKSVFWQALLATILIFGVGIVLGILLENWRAGRVEIIYSQSEVELLDGIVQSNIFSILPIDCENVFDENIRFADRIYSEANLLTEFDEASKITNTLKIAHKKYAVLRTLLWFNTMRLKQKCEDLNFDTVIYFYQLQDPSIEQKAKQSVFSKVLRDVKEERGNSMILIPIPADVDIASLEVLKKQYNITQLPAILINEKIKITNLEKVDDIIDLLEASV